MDLGTVGASVVAAVATKIVFHPIDTIRTLRQTSAGTTWRLPVRAYWNGLLPSMALSVPGFTVYLTSYRQTKSWLAPYLGSSSLLNYVASGGVAELASSFIWTPMEVLKGRMQLSTGHSQSVRTVIRDIYRTEGIGGFFRGYWMGIVVFLPHSVVWWVTYEYAKKARAGAAQSVEGEAVDNAASAALATTVAGTCTNFLDVVKTRQQLACSAELRHLRPDDQQSVLRVARNLIREAGFSRALFKGLGVRLMCSVPSSALTMVIVEYLQPEKSPVPQKPSPEALHACDVVVTEES